VRNLGQLLLGNLKVNVVLFDAAQIRQMPLDERVLAVASSTRSGEIVVCDFDLSDFLAEEDTDSRSHDRRIILEVMARTSMEAEALADSIEDVGILTISKVPDFLAAFAYASPKLLFVSRAWLRDPHFASIGYVAVSKPWKSNTVDVLELESRFDAELKEWQVYDPSRFLAERSPERDALASALGMTDTLESMKENYLYGRAIGEGVGKEHSHQWLAMDMKLEHFLWAASGHVAHVDHSDDVFLLREPTAEECAKSIAPLYQQMTYPLWHAFREGYWDIRRRSALEVLLFFDGWVVGEILATRAVANSRRERDAGNWQTALELCDDAEAAARAFCQHDQAAGANLLRRLKLVRGDVYLQSGQNEAALQAYDEARHELESLKAQGVPEDFSIASALINSAGALAQLSRREEARERIKRARAIAEEMPSGAPSRDFLLDTADRSLQGLAKP